MENSRSLGRSGAASEGTKNMYGTIQRIEEVKDQRITPIAPLEGRGGRLGLSQLLGNLYGGASMDGYKVTTNEHTIHVLIDNGQSCCESWGYFASEDDLASFIATELREVNLTDTALHKEKVEETGYYEDGGGIQFVDFVTSQGTFQLAVYNAHNGYYGHGIVVALDNDLLLNDTL
jgi:hypothetical protein